MPALVSLRLARPATGDI